MDNGQSGPCCDSRSPCSPNRREFLALGASAVGVSLFPLSEAVAGPFEAKESEGLVPEDKKFTRKWLDSLTARGELETFTGDDLKYIGMPVGGIMTGTLYLGGDGRLWLWDIFNREAEGIDPKTITYAGMPVRSRDGSAYVAPPEPLRPVAQGFALRVKTAEGEKTFPLDRGGFREVAFTGQYPIGTVSYRDPECPLSARLEVFSPFVPPDPDDSGLPASVLSFTLTNDSEAPVEATLTGWLENAVCPRHRLQPGIRRNQVVREDGLTFLLCSAEKPGIPAPTRPDVTFEDWTKDGYEGWTVEGSAFGTGPVAKADVPKYQGDLGGPGERVANSHASAPGKNARERDSWTGKLTSPPFRIERRFIRIWIGGGNHPGKTGVDLLIGGKVVASLSGRNHNRMTEETIDARPFFDKEALIRIVDAEQGGWGNVGVGRIVFSDRPALAGELDSLEDFGSMGLALIGPEAEHTSVSASKDGLGESDGDEAEVALEDKLVGALGRTVKLAPGESATADFAVVWHFPNLNLDGPVKGRHYYSARFEDAREVAKYLAEHFDRLASGTRLWRDTWYDSTLPYWFLDRTFANTSVLATTTCHRLEGGRFWAWEGIGCCPGTCTHVWQYAQAMGRVFPGLERDERERVDYGLGFDPQTGVVGFRAEFDRRFAEDGQCGTVLRVYREHQMSADDAFLKRLWPRVKQSLQRVMEQDREKTGIVYGPMHNTLDADWFGVVPWLVGLYHAALRAGEQMATELGDEAFARECRNLFEKGVKALDRMTWKPEYGYYVQLGDPKHPDVVGSYDGCHIDQVFGQSWAWQVGLGRVADEAHTKKALQSLWRYNVAPDVGPYRKANEPGRWYAMPGEGGLIMTTFPFGRPAPAGGPGAWSAAYFNECMSGFEWQVAGHMLWEGMVTEGLAVARLVHDRYHPRLRNPYNEVECSDHYARAMASYGAYLAACGFESHGSKGHIGFAPRLSPDDFKAAFTAAGGWGTFAQTRKDGKLSASLTPKHGAVRLKTFALELPAKAKATTVSATLAGAKTPATVRQDGASVTAEFETEVTVGTGQTLELAISYRG